MGRTIYAEERLLDYLKSLTRTDGYTVGLILGQSTEQRDYVVHLARTPPPASKDIIEEILIAVRSNPQAELEPMCIKTLRDIPNNWVADHAKHVTKMLPGGMWVLGIFVAGPGDSLSDNNSVQTLKSVMADIHRNLGDNEYIYGTNDQENLVLGYNSLSQKYKCKAFDMKRGGTAKPADWKFQANITKWHQLETHVDLDRTFPISPEDDSKVLKKLLQDILKTTADSVNSAMVVIEGEIRSLDDPIDVVGKMKKDRKDATKNGESDSDGKSLQVSLYIPFPENSSTDMNTIACSASIRLVGQLVSRTFLHQQATVGDAAVAVKHDVVRSLATRLEMHWDSLIEEEDGSPEENITLHEPPRRVLVELPQSKVTLSDYLFPGEGPLEALISLQELLDLEVQESSVQKEIEMQVDPSEFYCQNKTKAETDDSGKLSKGNTEEMLYIAGLVFGLAVAVIAFLLHNYS